MTIICTLFGHRVIAEPVWNSGFYFARCARCGADIVKIPGERWHRPRNARVTWQREAPISQKSAILANLPEEPGNHHEPPVQKAKNRQATPDHRRISKKASAIPDFMGSRDHRVTESQVPNEPVATVSKLPKRASPT
jgi:hypothetical protein